MEDKKPRITLASTENIEANWPSVERLLLAVGDYMGWKGDISGVFVSDQSSLSDFGLEPEEIAAIGRKLNVALDASDYLKDIAARMSAN